VSRNMRRVKHVYICNLVF